MARYFLIAGEKSGDYLGADLMRRILTFDPNATFQYWGGEEMMSVANGLQKHISKISFMGLVEVVKNFSNIVGLKKEALSQIAQFQPDYVVLIDYSGLNLRLLKKLKGKSFKTIYYVAPKVWAWNKSRYKTIKKYTDNLLVILPFEVDYFKTLGINAQYIGHPLAQKVPDFKPNPHFLAHHKISKPILALLPGSRKQEIESILPEMVKASSSFQEKYEVVIAGMTSLTDLYPKNVKIIYNDIHNLLSYADMAVVTSGTATLETALFNVPQVVCYKTHPITYAIAKRIVNVKYISLVNLILDKPIVKELIQDECKADLIVNELHHLEDNPTNYDSLLNKLSISDDDVKGIIENVFDVI